MGIPTPGQSPSPEPEQSSPNPPRAYPPRQPIEIDEATEVALKRILKMDLTNG